MLLRFLVPGLVVGGSVRKAGAPAEGSLTLVSSYSESNADDFTGLDVSTLECGQSFMGADKKIDSAVFYIKKVGTITAGSNVTAILYAHTGTYGQAGSSPTGPALATSDALDASTLTGSYQLITFSFPTGQKYQMATGTNYFIVLSGTIAGGGTMGMGADFSSSTYDGWSVVYDGVSYSDQGAGIAFYVYGR
jgi:hypothetical protein